jgi:CRP/FNR family transcriptional regulator
MNGVDGVSEMFARVSNLFPVLNMLPKEASASLDRTGKIERFGAGSVLLNQGNICPFVPLVVSGRLKVYILSPEGREVTLFYAHPGEFCLLGIACRMKTGALPSMVEVVEDAELYTIPAAEYETHLEHNADWNRFLFSTLYQHLFDAMSTMETLLFTRVDQRLAHYLISRCKGKACILYVTHEQIAAHLNTAREVVSRLMGELKRRNILDYERGKVKIIDLKALEELTQA